MADDFATLMRVKAVPLPAGNATHRRNNTATASFLPPYTTGGAASAEKFAKNGVAEKDVSQLRREHPQQTLDLHGMTSKEAYEEVNHFLGSVIFGERQAIQIIHGTGLHSPDGKGVLRCDVRHWLANCEAVLAYVEPPKNAGAVNVLLRKKTVLR